jgi:hypothetical protein
VSSEADVLVELRRGDELADADVHNVIVCRAIKEDNLASTKARDGHHDALGCSRVSHEKDQQRRIEVEEQREVQGETQV